MFIDNYPDNDDPEEHEATRSELRTLKELVNTMDEFKCEDAQVWKICHFEQKPQPLVLSYTDYLFQEIIKDFYEALGFDNLLTLPDSFTLFSEYFFEA